MNSDPHWSSGIRSPDVGDVVVRETRLSRKPGKGSGLVALASLAILVAASAVYWTDAFGISDSLPATRAAIFGRGEYWRLITSLCVHADLQHLLSNGIVFGVLAFLLYGYYGPRVYPGACLALGAVVTAISISSYSPNARLIGASGLVYLMVAFWLTLYLLVERGHPWRKRFVRAIGFGLIVLMPASVEPTVSYRTHAIGFFVGLAFGFYYFNRYKDELRSEERRETEF